VGNRGDNSLAVIKAAKDFLREVSWCWGLRCRRTRRGRPLDWSSRDDHICILIQALVHTCGLSPYRNKNRHGSTATVSACWVVAKALNELKLQNITEKGIEKIWQKRNSPKARPLPPYFSTPKTQAAYDKALKDLRKGYAEVKARFPLPT